MSERAGAPERFVPDLFVLALLGLAVLLGGCIERRIRVTSDPPGARVFLNDEPIGTTPCEARFTFYGNYDVRLELEGHTPVHEGREARAPLYETPGIDLVATLAPVTFENIIEWHYELTPVDSGEGARERLLERARELRSRSAAPPPQD